MASFFLIFFTFLSHNLFMNGRVFGIRKSNILKAITLLLLLLFAAYVVASIFLFKNSSLWFYAFCIFLGSYEAVKSFLFKYDSCLYIGSLFLAVGVVGFVFSYTNTSNFAAFFIALAFIAASVSTYIFTGQSFHLVIAFSIFFVGIYCFLYIKNLITTPILIAFLVPFLVLLILEILILCFHKK